MKNHPFILILSGLFLLAGCSVEPQPIAYGSDMCHFCKMTIVDRQYASEFVTTKGKCYKFDAIECMVMELEKWDTNDIGLVLVTDHSEPGKLVNARSATYLISPQMPSPMGANLTAFAAESVAKKVHEEVSGELKGWGTLVKTFHSQ